MPFIAPVVAEFLAAYPDVKVDLNMGERNRRYDRRGIRHRDPSDAAAGFKPDRAQPRHLAARAVLLARLSRKTRPAAALSELADHNCVRHVLYPFGDEWHFVDRKGAPASVRVSGNLMSNSGETLRTAALQGVGISLAPVFWSMTISKPAAWFACCRNTGRSELSMNAVYPHRHHLSAKVRTFIDMLAHHSAEQQKLINPYS